MQRLWVANAYFSIRFQAAEPLRTEFLRSTGVEKLQGTVYLVIDDSDRTLVGIEVTPVGWQQEKVTKPAALESVEA